MSVISYKCPNCGGELVFDPKEQVYKCPYCFSRFQDLKEFETKGGGEERDGEQEAVAYFCPSCGATIVTDETTAATFCYYCHSPVVLKGRVSGDYLPQSVIPFRIGRKEAEERFLEYVHSKRFVPKAFFSREQIEKLQGVYFPVWIFDGGMEGTLEADAARIRVFRSGDTEFTETKNYRVRRGGRLRFQNLPKNALKKASRELVEGVWPFPMAEEKEFEIGYLSGFFAERRDLEQDSFTGLVKEELKGYGERLLKGTVTHYDSILNCRSSFGEEEVKGRYSLVPIWTLTYRDRKGSLYYYTMNGQTGRVAGRLPLDGGKLAVLFFGIFIPVFLLCLLGGYFL